MATLWCGQEHNDVRKFPVEKGDKGRPWALLAKLPQHNTLGKGTVPKIGPSEREITRLDLLLKTADALFLPSISLGPLTFTEGDLGMPLQYTQYVL